MQENKRRAAKRYTVLIQDITNTVDLARAYFEDGALITAAQHLRQSADLLEQADQAKKVMLGIEEETVNAGS